MGKEITYESLQIEDAEDYYLVPLKDQESLHYIGNKRRLQLIQMVMDAKHVVATAGVNTKTCYIMVDLSRDEIEEVISKANKVPTRGRPIKDLTKY